MAGASRDIERAELVLAKLRLLGHTITVDWPAEIRRRIATGSLVPEDQMPDGESQDISFEELRVGVGTAEAVLFLAPPRGVATRGGWIEFGYALALRDLHDRGYAVVVSGAEARQSIFCRCGKLISSTADHVADELAISYLDQVASRKVAEAEGHVASLPAGGLHPYRTAAKVEQVEQVEDKTRPAHYGGKSNPLEPIKIITHYALNFCLGNAIKYVLRAGRKPGETYLDDLRKAREYLSMEIDAHEEIEHAREHAAGMEQGWCHSLRLARSSRIRSGTSRDQIGSSGATRSFGRMLEAAREEGAAETTRSMIFSASQVLGEVRKLLGGIPPEQVVARVEGLLNEATSDFDNYQMNRTPESE